MTNRTELMAILAEIRQAREETLAALADVTEADFDVPTPLNRWDSLRRVLLRFGEHMREHASQLEGIRTGIAKAPTPPQRMLAEAELAWGKLLAATVNLTDSDLDVTPADGGWTVREALQHMATVEKSYLDGARAGLQGK
ncbi:MAG: DinB family protein [Caldilineaceae bacterium]